MTLLTLALAGVLFALSFGPADAATTFIVNRTGDARDMALDGVCDVSGRSGNQCTLRAAIEEANATSGANSIDFRIPGRRPTVKTINVGSSGLGALPIITGAVTIDGYTQRGARPNTLAQGNDAVLKIVLNGAEAGDAHGLVVEAPDSTIRGLVINRFAGNGVLITGSGAKVLGNFVGTNASGTAALGNGEDGVEVLSASAGTVGGARAAARNVISGNADDGVEFQGDTLGNEVLGNFIGTEANGTEALGNSGDGVHILGEGNTVGGTVSGARNVISGNGGNGVDLQGINTRDNKIEGNFIGTQASSIQGLGNGEDGVNIRDGASGNTAGGTSSAAGNRIAHNGQDGVSVPGIASAGNSVLSNVIFSNGGTLATNLGIDHGTGGVTNNDTDDPDTGANGLQNFPVITSATRSNTTNFTTISGTLNSNPDQTYTVQCFVAVPDPSGHGEGQVPAGQDTTVTTDSGGDASFACVSPIPQLGQAVTATVTNTTTGDTSEFSENVIVVPGP